MRMGARISDRIGAIAESATLAVDAKAKALKAAGRPVIGFGAGEPDFPTPDYIVEAAVEAAPRPEEPPLHARRRAARAARGHRREDRCATPATQVDAAQVLVTNGGKQAVYNAFATLLDPGDEVLLIAPYWTTYPEAIKLAGGVPVEVVTDETTGYLATRRAARGGPHRAHQGAAVRLAVQPDRRGLPARAGRGDRRAGRPSTGLWVVTDEIYEHLVYGDARARLDRARRRRSWPTGSSSSTASPRPTR